MAKVTSTKKPPTPLIDSLRIELTGEEAEAIRDVFWTISGSVKDSRRAHTDAVCRELDAVLGPKKDSKDLTGSLDFASKDK